MFLPGMDLKAEILCRHLEEVVRQALAEGVGATADSQEEKRRHVR
jgi:hypothetical protein